MPDSFARSQGTWTPRFTAAVIVVAASWALAVISQRAGIPVWVAILAAAAGITAAAAVMVPQRRATGTVTRAVQFLMVFAGANLGFALSLAF